MAVNALPTLHFGGSPTANSRHLGSNSKAFDNPEERTAFAFNVWQSFTHIKSMRAVPGERAVSVKEFLNQRAVNISVGGQYTLGNWFDPQGKPRTFACRTSRVSPFRMMVAVPVVGKVGDRITSYFGDFGKLDGHISDTASGSFLLELAMTTDMREKFANKLTWLEKKLKNPSMPDSRRQKRIVPESPHSTLTFADGTTRSCFVIDMSTSGAAVSAEVQPPIGTPLAVGACVGRVVRLLPDGFAVEFVEQPIRADLERLVVRPTLLRSAASLELPARRTG